MPLQNRWKNFIPKLERLRLKPVETLSAPPQTPAPAAYPERIFKPLEPPAIEPAPETGCQHEWRIISSGKCCMQCGLQDPPVAPQPAAAQLSERERLTIVLCGGDPDNAAEVASIKAKLSRAGGWRF